LAVWADVDLELLVAQGEPMRSVRLSSSSTTRILGCSLNFRLLVTCDPWPRRLARSPRPHAPQGIVTAVLLWEMLKMTL